MSQGSCLCGSVTWEITAEPFQAFNCHCTQCQKVHGAAFGTYYFVRPDHIRWTSATDTIIQYTSSERLTRQSCDVCGSVVPYPSGEDSAWVAPAGCHDEGKKADCNIFVVDAAPWHEVTGDLPRHHAYPPETGYSSVAGKPRTDQPQGVVRGSCECGGVEFHVTKPFSVAHNCHCSRCRRARGAAHASNAFAPFDGVKFIKGEDLLKIYRVPGARYFSQVFCKVCSSAMPRLDPERNIAVIPLGSLDDDPGIKPIDHIFVADKAGWHEITDDLPRFEQGPVS
ncbi:MAG: GFA family protein [Hyphomicrobiales bacterium]|nr:GFA family protein [Hyphomicrobiales bacterium]